MDRLRSIINDPNAELSVRTKATIDLASIYHYQDPDSAENMLKSALSSAELHKDSVNIASAYYTYSQISSTKGNFKEAMKYDLLLLDIGTKMNSNKIRSDALNNLGEDYFDQGAYGMAYDHYQRSRKKAIEANDSLLMAITTYNVGKVLGAQGQLDRARFYLDRSKEISTRIDDVDGIVYCNLKLAEIEMKSGDIEKALDILINAESTIESDNIQALKGEVYSLFAVAYERKKQYSSALAYYDKLGEVNNNVGNYLGVGQSYLGKGSVWMELGDFTRSRSFLEQAVDIAREKNNKELLRDAFLELAVLNEIQGNYRAALDLQKKYYDLNDSLNSEQRNEQFANMQIMHETAQKDAEIRLMKEREQQQQSLLDGEEFKNNILVVILALGAVILFNLYRSSVKRKKTNKILLAHQKEIEDKSKEMEGLLSMKDKFLSIISHDLRSPINSLLGTIDMLNRGHLTEKESKDLMGSLKNRLNNTRKLLDNLLDWTLIQMDEIHIKMKSLDLYDIAQENVEFFHETNEKHIVFFNKVKKNTMVMADHNMLELILRNLIVNSIKFTQEGGFIEIDTEQGSDNMLVICISDNGIGMTEEQAEKLFDTTALFSTPGTANEQGTGLGLKLCKEFVDRMGGTIWVESAKDEGSVFKFTLKIPDRP